VRAELQAVLFDWGNTLVDFPGYTTNPARHLRCVEALYLELAAEEQRRCFVAAGIDWAKFRAAYEGVSAAQLRVSAETQQEHRLEDRLARTLRAAGCCCPLDPAAVENWVSRLCRLFLVDTRAVEGAAQVLGACSERYRLGVVANYPWSPLVLESLERFGLRRHLGTIVVSGEVGWIKPNARPFTRALVDLGVEPSRALFVGDDLVNDVGGAKALGLRTAWLTGASPDSAEQAADYALERLTDLLDLLAASPFGFSE
jgi:putative hydrolase of the HAD superfamily